MTSENGVFRGLKIGLKSVNQLEFNNLFSVQNETLIKLLFRVKALEKMNS